jgi:hypothetical protein
MRGERVGVTVRVWVRRVAVTGACETRGGVGGFCE